MANSVDVASDLGLHWLTAKAYLSEYSSKSGKLAWLISLGSEKKKKKKKKKKTSDFV